MELVSDKSDAELRKALVLGRLRWEMRELTANLLRVTRGAGKGYAVPHQLAAALTLFQEYFNAAKCYPSDYDVRAMLRLREYDEDGLPAPRHREEWDLATSEIVDGSLQFAASTLVYQIPQKSAGESELMRGVVKIEEIRERNRREWQESQRRVPTPRKKAVKRKPTSKS